MIKEKKSKVKILQAGRAWNSPIIWKDFYFGTGGFAGYAAYFFLTVFLLCIFLLFYYNSSHNFPRAKDIWEMLTVISVIMLGIQLTFLSSNVFSIEIRDKTHSTLMMLPMSLKKLAYSKILGCCLMLLPMTFLFFTSFFMANRDPFPDTFSKWSLLLSNIMYGTALVLCYLHMVTIFSLYVRYGSFAIAGLLMVLLQIILFVPMTAFMFTRTIGLNYEVVQMAYYIIAMTIYLLIIFFLHRIIGKRLLVLAGE